MHCRALLIIVATALLPGSLAKIRFKRYADEPGPTAAPEIQRRQLTRAELEARAKYPDLFNRRDIGGDLQKRDYEEVVSVVAYGESCIPTTTYVYTTTEPGDPPSWATETPVVTTTYQYYTAPTTTTTATTETTETTETATETDIAIRRRGVRPIPGPEPSPDVLQQQARSAADELQRRGRAKRSFMFEGKTVLAPRDAAAFMIGRGVFKWDNGTLYTDDDYAEELEHHRLRQQGTGFHRFYNVVVDAMGSKLLEISVPHYKKWTSTLRPDTLYPLSPSTLFVASDVDDLVKALLDDPEFEDVQYQRFRVNRRFLEAAYSY